MPLKKDLYFLKKERRKFTHGQFDIITMIYRTSQAKKKTHFNRSLSEKRNVKLGTKHIIVSVIWEANTI